MSLVTVEQHGKAIRFRVRLQPRASRTEIVGAFDGGLRVRVHAPPVDGAANDALVAFLAERLAVSRRDVRIVVGATSRTKTLQVEGITSRDVERLVDSNAEDRIQ